MAIVTTDDKHYKDIADKIRYGWQVAYNENAQNLKFKSSDMSSALGYVLEDGFRNTYANGFIAGKAEGIEQGITQGIEQGRAEGIVEGKKAEYDAFWDAYQNKGEAYNYYYAFANGRFTNANYNPKYDIVTNTSTTGSRYVFYNASEITDTKVAIYANGSDLNSMFYSCSTLKNIQKLVVNETQKYDKTFYHCYALENIVIEGVIGNDIDFSDCKNLTAESIADGIVARLSTTTTGKTITFSSECITKYWISANEFTALTHGHGNWTFTLV